MKTTFGFSSWTSENSSSMRSFGKWSTALFLNDFRMICHYFTVKTTDCVSGWAVENWWNAAPRVTFSFFIFSPLHVSKWNRSKESETWNEKAGRRRGREVTASYFLWDGALISLHFRGGADPLAVAAGSRPAVWRRLARCRRADQCIYNTNQPKEKGKSDHNVFMYVCVWEAWCVSSWCVLHASWWEVTWQTVPCDFSWDGAALRLNPQPPPPTPRKDPIRAQKYC